MHQGFIQGPTFWGGEYSPKLWKFPPQEFQDCLDFYVAGKMNRYYNDARLSSESNL